MAGISRKKDIERKAAIFCFFGALVDWTESGEEFVIRKDVVEATRKAGIGRAWIYVPWRIISGWKRKEAEESATVFQEEMEAAIGKGNVLCELVRGVGKKAAMEAVGKLMERIGGNDILIIGERNAGNTMLNPEVARETGCRYVDVSSFVAENNDGMASWQGIEDPIPKTDEWFEKIDVGLFN